MGGKTTRMIQIQNSWPPERTTCTHIQIRKAPMTTRPGNPNAINRLILLRS